MHEARPCPRCPGVGLFAGEARGLHPHACGRCGGVWLSADEASRVLRPLFTPGGLPGRPASLRCPTCSQDMTEWTVGATGIVLDSCPPHGTWFDHAELEALAVAAAELRGQPTPDFSTLRARELVPAAVAGAAAAIAVHAVAHADVLLAAEQLPVPTTSTGDTLAAAAIAAPDIAFAAVEVTASAAQVVGEAGVEVAAEAAGAGVEIAGGLIEGLLEFIAGLFG